MIAVIITLLVLGIIMGFLARAILPGEQKMNVISTIILGAVGSYLGAFIGFKVFNWDMSYVYNSTGVNVMALVAALVGSLIVLIIWCLITKRNWR